jgi:predicted permease
MPDWKKEIEHRLARSKMDAASQCDFAEELAQHLEDRYQDLIAAGREPGAAREAALVELENLDSLARARPRSTLQPSPSGLAGTPGSGNVLADLARDFRYGWRVLRKTPILTFFAVASLSLGIGANTTVFTIINTLLLHPLPVADSSSLVTLYESGTKGSKQARSQMPMSYLNFNDYAKQACFRESAAFTPPLVMTLQNASGPERVFGEFVGARYFNTLGLKPAAGRFFLEDEDRRPGSEAVAVLSYNAWKSRFGGSADTIGRKLVLNTTEFTVVGVAPQGFLGLSAVFGPDFWLPATMSETVFPVEFARALSDRGKPIFHAVARLQKGSTLGTAQTQLETVAAALRREYPDSNEGRDISVRPITDELFSSAGGAGGLAFSSAVLLAIVALILGIACSNVANLLLARATARHREVAVRLAIGANRGRLIRQMLTESVLLSLLSAALGLAVGYAGCQLVWSFVPSEVAGNMVTPKLDHNVLAVSLAVALLTAFLFGLAPALRASKTDVLSGLKEEMRVGGRRKRSRTFTSVLLTGQVAFSLVCLITAALFFRSIQRAYEIDPGFNTNRLSIFMVNPAQSGYNETRVKEFYDVVRDRLSTLPGVASVAWASGLPFWRSAGRLVVIEGDEERKKSDLRATVVTTVDTHYFSTMGIALERGRVFDGRDREDAAPVAVINAALAQERWPGGDAIGHRLQFTGEKIWRQVVGVVKTVNYTTLGEAPQPCVYLPLRQNFSENMVLYVQAQPANAPVIPAVRREIRSLDPNVDISDVRTGQKLIEQILWAPKIGVALLGVFGSLALALASVGLYGVMAYSVSQRRREIGVRAALGASRSTVIMLILRQGMTLVLYGIAAGLAGGLLVGRIVSRMLFGISSADPLSLGAASLILAAVALVACYLPARSATRIDPMTALRES